MLIFPVCTIIICITLGYIKEMHYSYHERLEEKKIKQENESSYMARERMNHVVTELNIEMTDVKLNVEELTKEVSELKQKVSALSLKAGFK